MFSRAIVECVPSPSHALRKLTFERIFFGLPGALFPEETEVLFTKKSIGEGSSKRVTG